MERVSGFGKFQGVSANPTTELVPVIEGRLAARGERRACVFGATVLETSATGSSDALSALQSSAVDIKGPVVWLHFGVAAGSTEFALEACAHNNATFRVPDERGVTLTGEPIHNGELLDAVRSTKLDLTPLSLSLNANSSSRYVTRVSTDPGRFICNYVYYKSLVHSGPLPKQTSLFCHVPLFSCYTLETQLDFACDLIQSICTQVLSDPSRLLGPGVATATEASGPTEASSGSALAAGPAVPTSASGGFTLPADLFSASLNLFNFDFSSLAGAFTPKRYKMVILVNMELSMGAGKIAAQCCHVALEAHRELEEKNAVLLSEWANQGEPIIVLKCPTLSEMEECGRKARAAGINVCSIRDAGRTQVAAGSKTVMSLGPADESLFQPVSGHLKLL